MRVVIEARASDAIGAPPGYGPVVRDALLDDLDPFQYDAVTSTAAPLAIIAPAGSGQTRVLTRRIAYGARVERRRAGNSRSVVPVLRKRVQRKMRRGEAQVMKEWSIGKVFSMVFQAFDRMVDDRRRSVVAATGLYGRQRLIIFQMVLWAEEAGTIDQFV